MNRIARPVATAAFVLAPAAMEALEQRRLLAADPTSLPAGDASPDPVEAGGTEVMYAVEAAAPRLVEDLDRGVIALNQGNGRVYVGWRLLGLDPDGIAFNVYRSTGGGEPAKVNAQPVTATTDLVDTGVNTAAGVVYSVRPVVDGVEGDVEGSFQLAPGTTAKPYLDIPLNVPAPGVTPAGDAYTYSANDASVGDLDGDGDYEILLKWDPSNAMDNTGSGYTGNVYIDAYTLEGQQLWRIDLGRNIRAGAHYTQMAVWDFDADGRAELMVKTAPGTIDGTGQPVLMSGDSASDDYRNAAGYVDRGSEYLTVFDGLTGAELDTIAFEPARGSVSQWGDDYGNRVDRFTVGVGYFGDDGMASAVFGRGYYGPQRSGGQARNEIATYDFREGELSLRWHFKAGYNINGDVNRDYIGQGAHGMSVADVDFDGRDEVIYGAATIDHDGTGLYSTGLGHGDAFHVSDMDPSRPGLEIFMVHESPAAYQSDGRDAGGGLRDAATGELLVQIPSNNDVGRGVALDIDPNYAGYEMWATTNQGTRYIYNVDGTPLYETPSNMFYNFGVWWDADPLRELLDRTTISKWNYQWANPGRSNFDLDPNSGSFYPPNVTSNNGTKATPALSGDILGDWREEVIWRTLDSSALHVYSTTIPAASRMYTLMHDTQYREAIAWQNGAYNQPPHPSFFVGAGMDEPPEPNIAYVPDAPETPKLPDFTDAYQAEEAGYGGAIFENRWAGYNGFGYVNFDATGFLEFANVDGGGVGGLTDVRVRYAVGDSPNPERDGTLTVNGQSVPIHFDNTGEWTNWVELDLQLDLLPGPVNTIRFDATGDDLANIDQIAIDRNLLPAPWVSADVGGGAEGFGVFESGTFRLGQLWDSGVDDADATHFVHQSIGGAGSITARLDSLTDGAASAGLMVRLGLGDEAAFGGVFVDANGDAELRGREQAGGDVTVIDGPGGFGEFAWLRLDFKSSSVTALVSEDRRAWETVGTLPLSGDPFSPRLAGMAIDANEPAVVAEAVFSEVAISRLLRRPVGGFRSGGLGLRATILFAPEAGRSSPTSAFFARSADDRAFEIGRF